MMTMNRPLVDPAEGHSFAGDMPVKGVRSRPIRLGGKCAIAGRMGAGGKSEGARVPSDVPHGFFDPQTLSKNFSQLPKPSRADRDGGAERRLEMTR